MFWTTAMGFAKRSTHDPLPDGLFDLPVGLFVEWRVKLFFGFSEKYFCFHAPQINSRTLDVPAHRGAFRERHKRWAGMRWTRQRA
jgi:hypothetical protein